MPYTCTGPSHTPPLHIYQNLRYFNKNLKALAHLISSDRCFPGLGDAGAHVSQVMDGGWATFVMTHWCRDSGLYDIPEAVRRITSGPARIMGLSDRGTLAVGKRADVNVFDLDSLHERMPEIVHDFPHGAPRFIQRACGYKATVCNGKVILRDDELTGARGGVVLRLDERVGGRRRLAAGAVDEEAHSRVAEQ